ncbi:hypothetical protein RS130_19585 [Paraglaciecola aquimarina]|uniref:Uncharacterized protein n=1 Tax=Paraglaciecola aquimarina TaxID=1235557 RepID=A0ABU3T0P0_9ALTE|nr:hypothetical protein [Paraglaciecola aquimarina]MDU0355793.1 hypothetical protein [Paraglaciecola aquimarina]
MLEIAKWYFIIGLYGAIYVFVGFLLVRHRIKNPVSFNESIVRAGGTILLWPLSLVSMVINRGFIEPLVTEVPFPFSEKIRQKSMDAVQEEIKAQKEAIKLYWSTLPTCGKYVFVKGENESSKQFKQCVYIFRTGEFSHHLKGDTCNEFTFCRTTQDIEKWLDCRDEELHFCTEVPQEHDSLIACAIKILKAGIGEAYCAECNEIYKAESLVKPSSKNTKGPRLQSLNSISCPKNHLLSRRFEDIGSVFI